MAETQFSKLNFYNGPRQTFLNYRCYCSRTFFLFSPETFSKLNFYKKVPKADFPNLHDYHCSESRLFDACELAVYDVTEAKYKCDLDERCKAFVVTGKILWSGKWIHNADFSIDMIEISILLPFTKKTILDCNPNVPPVNESSFVWCVPFSEPWPVSNVLLLSCHEAGSTVAQLSWFQTSNLIQLNLALLHGSGTTWFQTSR